MVLALQNKAAVRTKKIKNNRLVQPLLKWAGGKRWLVPLLRNCAPKKYNRFIEPFLGGAASFKEEDGKHFIYGNGCPIAAATANHPEACLLAESLLAELIGSPVKEHCVRGPTPSCRFEVK